MSNAQNQLLSINDLIYTFRDALVALIPSVERLGIKWRYNKYNDWERIELSVFKSIVSDFINQEVEGRGFFPIGPYDAELSDFSLVSFIVDQKDNNLMFVRLDTQDAPFDSVVLRRFDKDSFKLIGESSLVSLKQATLAAVVRSKSENELIRFVNI